MRAVTAEQLRLPSPPGRTSTTPRSRPAGRRPADRAPRPGHGLRAGGV